MRFRLLIKNFYGLIVEMIVRILIVVRVVRGSSPSLYIYTCSFICQFSEETNKN